MPFSNGGVKTTGSPDAYWQEYEKKTNEKVLAKSIGHYLSGWDEFDASGKARGNAAIGGLLIATSGGFRFHHFPNQHWLNSIVRFRNQEPPEEKEFFIPKEQIVSVRCAEEKKWWKKLLSPSLPRVIIQYRDGTGNEKQLMMELDFKPKEFMDQLLTFNSN